MTERVISIEGPMFSGKTLELLRTAETLRIAGKNPQIFKPIIDDRGEGTNKIRSRFGSEEWEATPVKSPPDIIWNLKEGVNAVLIDEIQFFGQKDDAGQYEIVKVVKFLVQNDILVVFAGLPRDFRREPFGPMPELLALAQEKRVLVAICDETLEDGKVCGQPATETQRFVDGMPADWNDPVILVGDRQEGYAARCLKHHRVENSPVIVFSNSQ